MQDFIFTRHVELINRDINVNWNSAFQRNPYLDEVKKITKFHSVLLLTTL